MPREIRHRIADSLRRPIKLDQDEPGGRPPTRRLPPTSLDPREIDQFADPRDRSNPIVADFLTRIGA